jgi:hypothetical protein
MGWRGWVVGAVVLVIACKACKADEEYAPMIQADPNYVEDHPRCTARASAYFADGGCLGPKQFFGQVEAFGGSCPFADASVCVQVAADAGLTLGHETWVFSGEHYGIPDGRRLIPCDEQTAAIVTSAPACPGQ